MGDGQGMGMRVEVIHVDDDSDFLEMSAEFLERANDRLAVETETDPDRALNRLKLRNFQCVVSDYEMPGTDGLELLEAVRRDHPRLPFILFTGKGSEGVASEAVRLDVTGYQQKGYGKDQFQMLANTIEKAVDGYQARSLANRNERQLLRYKQAVEHSDDLVAAIDRERTYLFVNQAFLSYHDRERDEVEGHPFEDVLSADTVGQIDSAIERTFDGETVNFQFQHSRPGGSVRYFDISYYPLRTSAGRIEGLVSEMRDITTIREQILSEGIGADRPGDLLPG